MLILNFFQNLVDRLHPVRDNKMRKLTTDTEGDYYGRQEVPSVC